MNTISHDEYLTLKKLNDDFEAWRGGRSGYSSDSVPPHLNITNAQRSQIEVYEFVNDPPERYFIYIDVPKKIATTWTGDKLGDVEFGREYKSPAFGSFPSTRVPVTIKAINGYTYHGTYYKSSGDYARIKMAANSKRKLQNKLTLA